MTTELLLAGSETAQYLAQINPGSPQAPPGGDRILLVVRWILWGLVVMCIVGVSAAGAMLALGRNGMMQMTDTAEGRLLKGILGAAVFGIAGTLVNTLVF
ncbi:hypothetical protein [Hoyosella altamirensis]|uniref:Uncharacterized protein n=1 Tax=Hoyosella altamirensis TaxID=616997 RepID=A0A839RT91_9ACTN|nr:hypothetical protein [Hoyosella altamirensis]MBB3040085.1 hypothetical protein [Hoyosella altamirensis]